MYVIYNNIYYDYATTNNYIQWNLSNPKLQGSREMCWIVQGVGKLRFYFS